MYAIPFLPEVMEYRFICLEAKWLSGHAALAAVTRSNSSSVKPSNSLDWPHRLHTLPSLDGRYRPNRVRIHSRIGTPPPTVVTEDHWPR